MTSPSRLHDRIWQRDVPTREHELASLSDSLIVTDGSRRQNDILRMEAVSRAGSNHNHLFDLATEELILCVP
jgi:hypothetical protein